MRKLYVITANGIVEKSDAMDGIIREVLFGKLDDAVNVTLNATILC